MPILYFILNANIAFKQSHFVLEILLTFYRKLFSPLKLLIIIKIYHFITYPYYPLLPTHNLNFTGKPPVQIPENYTVISFHIDSMLTKTIIKIVLQ